MKIENFKHNDWEVQWSGSWSILSISYFGYFYCQKPFANFIDIFASQTILTCKNSKTTAFIRAYDKMIFANKLEQKIKKDKKFANFLCKNLKKETDIFLKFVDKNLGKDISFNQYIKFQDLLINHYYAYHVAIKVIVDHLEKDVLKKYLPIFEKARIYAEPVFTKSEQFMIALANIHSKKTGYNPELILALTNIEFENYFKSNNRLPDKTILQQRIKLFSMFYDQKHKRALNLTNTIFTDQLYSTVINKNEIEGATGYPGKIRGRVKIILDPNKSANFKKGDVLVTGMTRPEYLSLIKKASAIVTDAGGILCHAAITARELKKPCVIGTKNATTILKDNDMIEVDANNGVIKILS